MAKNKALENIISGLERYFSGRFHHLENIDIKPLMNLDNNTYSMMYRGIHYFFSFDEDYNFFMEVELKEKDESVRHKLEVYRIPNEKLEKTKYIKNQEIEIVDNKIKINCRLNKYPISNREITEFCGNLWTDVIKNIMLSIY